jgi:DUF4097 and DUF4098 domain-containing protein YvlB
MKMNTATARFVCSALLLLATRFPALAAEAPALSNPSSEFTAPPAEKVTKTFSVEAGGRLIVDVDQGNIEVLGQEQNTVEIVLERKISGVSEEKRADFLKGHHVTFTQHGGEIRVQAETTRPLRNLLNRRFSLFHFRHPNLEVVFRVTVPKKTEARLKTAGGNIEVANLEGKVEAASSGGNLTFTKIQGPVDAHTSGGNIKIAGAGDQLRVKTDGGNIDMADFAGPSAEVDTSGGNVRFTRCAGNVRIHTSGGNIDLRDLTSPSVQADTSGGDISAEFGLPLKSDSTLHTSGGRITVTLPASAALNLDAKTDGGSVSTAFPVTVQGKLGEGKLSGAVNGGGPTLTLHTSGGDIRIKKQ